MIRFYSVVVKVEIIIIIIIIKNKRAPTCNIISYKHLTYQKHVFINDNSSSNEDYSGSNIIELTRQLLTTTRI